MTAGVARQLLVVHGDVDTRLKGRVDVCSAVGGEEEDAGVVLQDAEEDGDELVALEVVCGAGFEEDVRFVEEEDLIKP